MKNLKQTYLINAPIEKVWEALTDPKIIDEWGAGPVKMNDQEGFEFELWGGDIHGKNTKVIKEKELTQDWLAGEWEMPSKVNILLSNDNSKTKLELNHTDIPDTEFDEIKDGWKEYYLGPMKEYLELT